MKLKKTLSIVFLTMILCAGAFLLAGCGSQENFAEYMKGQPAMRGQIDAQLNILSPDAKATVLYEENTAEITVTYYALTQKELEGEETEKATARCNVIMQDAVDSFHEETGGTAEVKVTIYGHDVEKK